MSILKAVTFKIVDAKEGSLILGPGLYNLEGKRVGQLVAEEHEVTTYGSPMYLAVKDERT